MGGRRDSRPAVVRTAGKGGILRIDFGEKEENLVPIEWDEFFQIFDSNELAFLHQDKADELRRLRASCELISTSAAKEASRCG